MAIKYRRPTSSGFFDDVDSSAQSKMEALVESKPVPKEAAIVYCEGSFGGVDGETAHSLVRYSGAYSILSVIDSENAEKDSGKVLDGKPNGIPIYRDLGTALAQAAGQKPKHLILGMSAESGVLTPAERKLLMRAIGYRINIASALHESLNADSEFAAACEAKGVTISEVR